MPVKLEVKQLTCRFGAFEAVKSIDLAIEPGEFFTLLGPSGCGKSTTLKMVGGFIQPYSGSILVDGQDVTALSASERPTNYVFQNYALFPHLTVAANVEYGLKRQGLPPSERHRRVSEELERVGMSAYASRLPAALSGGQQQRVALARALANRPKVLLLDEPLSALDYLMRKQLRDELKTIQNEVGTTTVFVTHDQSEALSMSDRIAVMKEGRIEQIGSPDAIYRTPRTSFIASFIGDANLLACQVISVSTGEVAVELDGGAIVPVRAEHGVVGAPGQLMIRPEDLHVLSSAAGRGKPVLQIKVVDHAYVGERFEVKAVTAAGQQIRFNSKTPLAGLENEHCLTWEPASAHLVQ